MPTFHFNHWILQYIKNYSPSRYQTDQISLQLIKFLQLLIISRALWSFTCYSLTYLWYVFPPSIFLLITSIRNCLRYFTRDLTSANFGENIFTFLLLQISVPALPQTAFAVLSSSTELPGLDSAAGAAASLPYHRHKGWEQVKSWGLCLTWLVSEARWSRALWAFAYFLLPLNRPLSQLSVSKSCFCK